MNKLGEKKEGRKRKKEIKKKAKRYMNKLTTELIGKKRRKKQTKIAAALIAGVKRLLTPPREGLSTHVSKG